MTMPAPDSKVTKEQVDQALNIVDFRGAQPGPKAWHYGQFEPWALKFGYADGKPIYGSVTIPDGNEYHIYFLNDAHQGTIILKRTQAPANYGISPQWEKVAGKE